MFFPRRFLVPALLVLLAAAAAFWLTLPDVRPLAREFPRTTAFMERKRTELRRQGQAAALDYRPVPLRLVSPFLARAVVAAEDARFYEHTGMDWEAIRGALAKDWQNKRLKRGGSTVTQQLAKNLYLSPARTPWRKLREWAIVGRLERALSKARILELYMNVIEFGPRTYGVEAAARRYFHKPASALTAREAATLAAMIPSPRLYDPARNPARVGRRAARILRGM
ncbi:MAG: monofunctional biosynthetic peptidoglycan transglycosylase [Acidobacteria bacterium]|nr:monofunctional biosynthetic peptidoglycan transglycosylase [Acidobacteriota bacterium]MCA1610023.1 monofunctional biosynthetic peptidoglycan transglycosylase [Acidobacteriota bacterium]